jgi:microsomal epoxide hydrolase
LDYLKELVHYWQDGYAWRMHEQVLNEFAHFKTDVDDIGIHFIHERGKGPNPFPLILTHGYPDSFLRFTKIIPILTDPEAFGGRAEDAFDVVIPDLPGYGFSDRPPKHGTIFRSTSRHTGGFVREGKWAAAFDSRGELRGRKKAL